MVALKVLWLVENAKKELNYVQVHNGNILQKTSPDSVSQLEVKKLYMAQQ